jgi:predicted permease
VPEAHRETTLGDLQEDLAVVTRTRGPLVAAVWLIRECRDVTMAFTARQTSLESRTHTMPTFHASEFRFALRRIWRHRGVSLAAMVTLAASFTAALATWAMVDAVLLTPIPAAHEPDRLMVVRGRARSEDGRPGRLITHSLFPLVAEVRDSGPFSQVAAIAKERALIGDPVRPLWHDVGFVTHNFFETLGIPMARGRNFVPEDDRDDAPVAIVLMDAYWSSQFQRSPDVLGTVLQVGRTRGTIVGIAPPTFRGIDLSAPPAILVPVQTAYSVLGRDMDYLARGIPNTTPTSNFTVVGRVSGDAMPAQVTAALTPLSDGRHGVLEATSLFEAALPDSSRQNVHRFTQLLVATVGFLLAIGIASVGLLLLIRAEARRDDLAMCLALGASRWRLTQGVLAESLWLSLGGLAMAVPMTVLLLGAARAFELPGRISLEWLSWSVDVRVVLLAVGVVCGATVVIGLMAAAAGLRHDKQDPRVGRSQMTTGRTGQRVRRGLVVAQVAVAMVLIAGTSLFARSVYAAAQLNAALAPEDIVTTALNVRGFSYLPARTDEFFRHVYAQVAVLPSVTAASFRADAGGMSANGVMTLNGERRPVPSGLAYVHVDEHYFSTVGLRVLAGRDFTAGDVAESELVGIVSESLGRFIARGGSPLGMTITESFRRADRPAPDNVRIVGVVPDVVSNVRVREPMTLYYTMRQRPPSPYRTLFLRTERGMNILPEIRNIVERQDPRIVLGAPMTLRDVVVKQMAPQQFGAAVLGSLATVALVLTLLGAFVVAETMARTRERELAIRAALGATARRLGGLVVSEAIVLAVAGVVVGALLAWAASSTIEALLYQVAPMDPVSLAVAACAILLLTAVVTARPALSATRIDIVSRLRE